MNNSRDKILFWCLLAAQAVGSQVIIWTGLPVYHRLLSHDTHGAGAREFGIVLAAVVVMQLGYWINRRLQPRLRFHQNVVGGHLLQWLGEISYFFPHALAAVIIFDRLGELKFVPGKLLALAAILFAVFCYKLQLESLGEEVSNGGNHSTGTLH